MKRKEAWKETRFQQLVSFAAAEDCSRLVKEKVEAVRSAWLNYKRAKADLANLEKELDEKCWNPLERGIGGE
ncbi:MAG TPA: hypothetical protein PKZ00_11800 [Elusimicrobiota bacterium]|nr:hypothetical protein [Elusimicrobiota bacterium]